MAETAGWISVPIQNNRRGPSRFRSPARRSPFRLRRAGGSGFVGGFKSDETARGPYKLARGIQREKEKQTTTGFDGSAPADSGPIPFIARAPTKRRLVYLFVLFVLSQFGHWPKPENVCPISSRLICMQRPMISLSLQFPVQRRTFKSLNPVESSRVESTPVPIQLLRQFIFGPCCAAENRRPRPPKVVAGLYQVVGGTHSLGVDWPYPIRVRSEDLKRRLGSNSNSNPDSDFDRMAQFDRSKPWRAANGPRAESLLAHQLEGRHFSSALGPILYPTPRGCPSMTPVALAGGPPDPWAGQNWGQGDNNGKREQSGRAKELPPTLSSLIWPATMSTERLKKHFFEGIRRNAQERPTRLLLTWSAPGRDSNRATFCPETFHDTGVASPHRRARSAAGRAPEGDPLEGSAEAGSSRRLLLVPNLNFQF